MPCVPATIQRWRPGCCLILDDTVEHEAWNHGSEDRVVLTVTLAHPPR
ncbi:MAG TPA: aspartyl/asparaginyl beta-hydroxylase domain-containing protein [Planctomycetota bacterium]|nr:aspartyl/asparaginyl beta-hydroxylase domain-containing protein [Planctomycetota bacterium]